MHAATLSLKQHGLVVSLLAALWATGCGGSFSGAGAGGSGATSGGAGSGATAGVGGSGATSAAGGGGSACDLGCPAILCEGTSVIHPGDCCPTCEPGGSGGVSNGGSAGSCAQTACPAIACAVGYKYVYQPGECCPTCVPDDNGGSGGVGGCALVDCAAPDCAVGYVAQQQPDACCPVCVPNTVCTKGQQGYDALRSKLLAQPGAMACKVDKDCTLLGANAYSGDVCPHVPVNAAAAQSIDAQLSSFAKENCSTCTPLEPPCPYPGPAVCVQGQCTIDRLTPAE